MKHGAFKHFFAEHLTKVLLAVISALLGLLCTLVIAAWTDLSGEVEGVRLEFEAKYATKDELEQRVEIIDLKLRAVEVGEAVKAATLERIDGRLLDIGDRLGRIEGELRGRP